MPELPDRSVWLSSAFREGGQSIHLWGKPYIARGGQYSRGFNRYCPSGRNRKKPISSANRHSKTIADSLSEPKN